MIDAKPPARPASYDKKVALVLQGGGALGSYQAGVYEALASSEYVPDWVAGISIGAINAAIIAGNAPENRVSQLRSFWEEVTSHNSIGPSGLGGPLAEGQRRLSSLVALMFGQPGFFAPRPMLDWISFPNPTSYYNTSLLRSTLERLVDFDRINAKAMRFSVGAVNVRTGRFAYFDNDTVIIRPEHVMASGALPPGFPAVEIDGEQYWDGGLVSNTPLQYVLDYLPRRSRLSFQVDLFHAHGRIPTNLEEVNERGTPRLLLQLRSDCYFVSIRLGAVLGVCSAGEITNVTQAFMHRSSNCSSRPCAANPSPLAAGCARRLV